MAVGNRDALVADYGYKAAEWLRAFYGPWAELVENLNRGTAQFEGFMAACRRSSKRPRNGPHKCPIDGHDYHRRQRNRVKRKNRR